MKQERGIIAWLTYALFRVIVGILYLFPINWNLRTARIFARLWWRLIPRHRDRAIAHVRLALGDELTESQIHDTARKSLEQLAMLAIEFIFAPRLLGEWTWNRYIKLRNMGDAIQHLLSDKGALLLTGHFGNWELAGYLLAVFGVEVSAIMRPLDNAYLNDYVVRIRRKKGLDLIDKKGASTGAAQIIERGGIVGFIADQNAGRKGVFVDFFGVPASTYKSIGLLAMASEAPIIVGYAHRTSHRFEYEIGVERIITPDEWKDQTNPLLWITQQYTLAIEASVRRAPEQYLWIHRRWKSRPRNESPEFAAKLPQTAIS